MNKLRYKSLAVMAGLLTVSLINVSSTEAAVVRRNVIPPTVFGNGLVVFNGTSLFGQTNTFGPLNVNGNMLDFGRGGSKIEDNGDLTLSTDNYLFLNAANRVTVQNDLRVRGQLQIFQGNKDNGSSIYDNGDLVITTNDALRLQGAQGVEIQSNALLHGNLKVNGTVTLPNGSIAGSAIANGAIDNSKLADAAVTSAKIADGTILNGDLSDNSVTTAKIVNGTIITEDLADQAVTNAKLGANAVTTDKISDGTILNGDLSDNSVTTAKIVNGTIITEDLADQAVTNAKLGADAVTTDKVADGTIVDADISGTAAISLSKLASGSSANIIVANGSGVPTYVAMSGDATIDTAGALTIGADAIGSSEVMDGTLTNDDISAGAGILYGKLSIADGDLTIAKTSGLQAALDSKLNLAGGTMTGNINLDGNDITNGGTITATSFVGPLTGNADTVTNGVYTTDSHDDPAFIQWLSAAKLKNNTSASLGTGTVTASTFTGMLSGNVTGDVTGNVTGNAGTVTNGVYDTGSYADPSWITSLAGSKIFGPISLGADSVTAASFVGNLTGNVTGNVTGDVSGNAGTVSNGVYDTGSYADPAWITSLAGSKITGSISLGAGTVTAATFTGDLTGNVTGNVTGNLTGNQSGGSVNATSITSAGVVDFSAGTASIQLPKVSSTPSCSGAADAGKIVFSNVDSHFYGCDGTVWKQLDN